MLFSQRTIHLKFRPLLYSSGRRQRSPKTTRSKSAHRHFSLHCSQQHSCQENEFPIFGLQDNTSYYWRTITQFDQNGWGYQSISDVFTFNTGKITEIEKPVEILRGLSTYPNPFERDINIAFHLKKPGAVALRIVDRTGREIFTEHFAVAAGDNIIQWKGNDTHGTPLQNGVYLGHIQTGNEVHHVKMVLRR